MPFIPAGMKGILVRWEGDFKQTAVGVGATPYEHGAALRVLYIEETRPPLVAANGSNESKMHQPMSSMGGMHH